ncbi:RidA family protein [Agrobacterium sp. 22-222-1]
MWITPLPPSLTALGGRSHGSILNGNYASNRLSSEWKPTAHGYSAAIRSGDLLFVSGQVGSRLDGTPESDFAAQVRQAFANLKATLAAGGCTLDDVVDVTTFHTDPEKQFETIMAVKGEMFPQPPYPNWTAVGVTLPGLARPVIRIHRGGD